MADFALSDVDVVAVSICKGPANRKRFYLRKSEEIEGDLLPLGRSHSFIKSSGDWDTVYCVVAEPGSEEHTGSGRDAIPGTTDVWADADEIRKAAHRFIQNGGLINRQHESLEPYGTLVENFIAQADMTIEGQLIKAGSWVVGIKPTDEGRRLIEAGEWDGVSYEGTGRRTRIEKREADVDRGLIDRIVKALRSERPQALTVETVTVHGEDEMTDEQIAQLAKVEGLESQLTELTKDDGRLAKLETNVAAILERLPEPTKDPEEEAAELRKSIEKMEADLQKATDRLDKLAEGGSQQGPGGEGGELKKMDADQALASALFN